MGRGKRSSKDEVFSQPMQPLSLAPDAVADDGASSSPALAYPGLLTVLAPPTSTAALVNETMAQREMETPHGRGVAVAYIDQLHDERRACQRDFLVRLDAPPADADAPVEVRVSASAIDRCRPYWTASSSPSRASMSPSSPPEAT